MYEGNKINILEFVHGDAAYQFVRLTSLRRLNAAKTPLKNAEDDKKNAEDGRSPLVMMRLLKHARGEHFLFV